MDVNTLLSTLIQAQAVSSLQSGLSPNLPATPRLDPNIPPAAAGAAAAVARGSALPGGPSVATGLALASGTEIVSGTAVAGGAAVTNGAATPGGPAVTGGAAFTGGPAAAGGPASTGGTAATGGPAAIYHSSAPTASPSLLAQSGVNAYVHLLNAVSTAGQNEKSADLLTSTLLGSSAALKSAYSQALSKLPTALQAKDWRFSVSDGNLVFAAGEDELSAQDLLDLKAAFEGSNVQSAANQVAAAITTMDAKRSSGTDFGSLAWGRLEVDGSDFGQVIDLRTYLTATAPGGKYIPSAASPGDPNQTTPNTNLATRPDVPLTLGGMYLGDLVTSRPGFFRPDFASKANALLGNDATFDSQANEILHGRCACGEVSFTVPNALDYAFYCHCSRCRVRTGSAFAAIGAVSIDQLQVTAGNRYLLIEGECSDGYGARCSRCHAFLFAAVRGRQYAHVSLGVLAGAPSRLPDHHIYVGSKAPWYQITDALPQYDELP